MKPDLERIEVPAEEAARARTWLALQAAFADREPARPSPTRLVRPILAVAVVAAVVAAALSPAGRAVLDEIREVVGVERAQPALFSLPAQGRLLVASDAGVWVVDEEGSKRLLGDYREASWSPFGRFVVAARENELVALEPDGDVRWTLSRPAVRSPRWTGTETDTRIAYVDRSGLRVVAGDGTGDRLLVPGFRGEIAWRPGSGYVLALARAREIRVLDTETSRTLWSSARATAAATVGLDWSADGRRLLVISRRSLVLHGERGATLLELGPGAAPFVSGELDQTGRRLVFVQETQARNDVWIVPRIRPDASAARRLFSGAGSFDDLSWSPDGDWVLLPWASADQWVFLRADGSAIRAVADISGQFRSRSFPRVEGWCCGD